MPVSFVSETCHVSLDWFNASLVIYLLNIDRSRSFLSGVDRDADVTRSQRAMVRLQYLLHTGKNGWQRSRFSFSTPSDSTASKWKLCCQQHTGKAMGNKDWMAWVIKVIGHCLKPFSQWQHSFQIKAVLPLAERLSTNRGQVMQICL